MIQRTICQNIFIFRQRWPQFAKDFKKIYSIKDRLWFYLLLWMKELYPWRNSFPPSLFIIILMGVKENKNQGRPSKRAQPPSESDSENESNETMPVGALQSLSLGQRANSNETVAPQGHEHYLPSHCLKNKPIRKRERGNEEDCKERMRAKIDTLSKRILQLQEKLREVRKQEDACPHCHFYLNQPGNRQDFTPDDGLMLDCYKRSLSSRDSLQFQKMDFAAPLMYSAEMEERSWVFLGTVLIAMGSKVMDMDGTVNVFKVLKESVDRIRRQVQKSEEKLSMEFFLGREEIPGETGGMEELSFDPFYRPQEKRGGLQLQGVRVESVEEYELFFDQKLTFNVKYDALITIMEYMKENSSITLT